MEIVLGWLVFAVVVGIIASSRGRSGFSWFLLACVLSPILAVILVALMPSKKAPSGEELPSPRTHIKCPDCKELVIKDARVCKHCGCRLVPQT